MPNLGFIFHFDEMIHTGDTSEARNEPSGKMMQIENCPNVSAVRLAFTNTPVTRDLVLSVKSLGWCTQAVTGLPKLTDLHQQTLTRTWT